MAPVTLLNDGLLDTCFQHGPAGISDMLKFVKYAINGKGQHIHRDDYAYFRSSSIRITNKNLHEHPAAATEADSENLGIEENDLMGQQSSRSQDNNAEN